MRLLNLLFYFLSVIEIGRHVVAEGHESTVRAGVFFQVTRQSGFFAIANGQTDRLI